MPHPNGTISPADFDRPVPADAKRGTLPLSVDLTPSSDCEERFDLAVYTERAVEMIAWDAHRGACADRHVKIQYLTGKLTEERLLGLVREHAKRVEKDSK